MTIAATIKFENETVLPTDVAEKLGIANYGSHNVGLRDGKLIEKHSWYLYSDEVEADNDGVFHKIGTNKVVSNYDVVQRVENPENYTVFSYNQEILVNIDDFAPNCPLPFVVLRAIQVK